MRHLVKRRGVAWLELLLILSILSLLVQLVPGLVEALDFRTWSRSTWIVVNVIIVSVLIGVRFLPDVFFEWIDDRKRNHGHAARREQQKMAKERRESIQRIKASRKRRLY